MTEDVAPAAVLDKIPPAHIAPVVVYLLSEESTDTGRVIAAGGGEVKRLQYFESQGATFSSVPSVAEIAEAWPSVVSMDGAVQAVNPAG
jgi:hypothetical protein